MSLIYWHCARKLVQCCSGCGRLVVIDEYFALIFNKDYKISGCAFTGLCTSIGRSGYLQYLDVLEAEMTLFILLEQHPAGYWNR